MPGEKKNIHKNHRKRMMARYENSGLDSFEEHEILELMLFYAIPRRDTNEIAHRLIDRFQNLYGVLTASEEELTEVSGIGASSARFLQLVRETAKEAVLRKLAAQPILTYEQLYRIAVEWFSGKPHGTVAALFLDSEKRWLKLKEFASAHTVVPPSLSHELLLCAQSCHASGIVLMHNHADGCLVPSPEDLFQTGELYSFLASHDIRILEHLIVHEFDVIPILEKCGNSFVSGYPRSYLV